MEDSFVSHYNQTASISNVQNAVSCKDTSQICTVPSLIMLQVTCIQSRAILKRLFTNARELKIISTIQ